ncbi:MAG: GNAT family N-acetyltransferase [bacterium]|nr:GNAT family N-acetyltransferase [bacterium]
MPASFQQQPDLAPALFNLLDLVFPGLAAGAAAIRQLGASWEDVSTPFVVCADGVVLSHVGLIELPLVLMGQPVAAGTLHAVATRPDHRGKGLFRRVMTELLAHAASRHEILVLTTEHPEYFTPFGFRHVPEHAFRLPCRHGGGGRSRRLDPAQAVDLALLHRLSTTRQPVSRVVGVGPQAAILLFNESRRPLWYVEELDALLCLEHEGDLLRLFDVVAPKPPSWPALLAALPWPVSMVEFNFAPDQFAPRAKPVARLLEHDGPSWLMVRGPWPPDGRPFTLPRSART